MKNLTPIILIVLSIGLFYFQINPTYVSIKALRVEAEQYDAALETANELKSIRGELQDKLKSFSQTDLDRLDKFLPKHLDVVRLVLDVNGIATQDGLLLKDIKTGSSAFTAGGNAQVAGVAGAKEKLYAPSTLTFSLSTTYPNFLQFLKDVEKSLRLTDVTAISIKQSDKKVSGLFDFGVTLQTYFLK